VFISKWKKESNLVIPIKQVGVQIFFCQIYKQTTLEHVYVHKV
jgi:hypothetical protein